MIWRGKHDQNILYEKLFLIKKLIVKILYQGRMELSKNASMEQSRGSRNRSIQMRSIDLDKGAKMT